MVGVISLCDERGTQISQEHSFFFFPTSIPPLSVWSGGSHALACRLREWAARGMRIRNMWAKEGSWDLRKRLFVEA
jgi:hypothetical protein